MPPDQYVVVSLACPYAFSFPRGIIWWKKGTGPWQQTVWHQPTASMPIPIRDTLEWTQELVAGQWPGAPVPSAWADWADHLRAPVAMVARTDAAPHGTPPPLTLTMVMPEKPPYHGDGLFGVFWTASTTGRWTPQVESPNTWPLHAPLARLWSIPNAPRS